MWEVLLGGLIFTSVCEDSKVTMRLSTPWDPGCAELLLISGRLMSQGSLSLYIYMSIYYVLRLLLSCGTHKEALNALGGHSEQPCLSQ